MTAAGAQGTAGVRTAERLLRDLRTDIARADTKASILVAVLGSGAGALGGGTLGDREPPPGRFAGAAAPLWWTGLAALAVSITCLMLAVLPRYRGPVWRPGAPLTYFGDVRQAAREGRLADALAATEREPVAGLVTALTENSRIALRKHQWIHRGLLALCAAAVLLPLALLLN
ncbi:Pycsar system effector family protein [Streptomyces sp. NPDC050560]|uniref:Pycsar system effector family protein n=1 Tax=Streptomyces sp. NPDC050560 TaxID=3365630 RepID=UPI00378E429C